MPGYLNLINQGMLQKTIKNKYYAMVISQQIISHFINLGSQILFIIADAEVKDIII